MRWQVTSRFLRDYGAAAAALQVLAEGEVQVMQKRSLSSPNWAANYRRLRGIPGAKIIELELGGGPRLLAQLGGETVTLLAMGNHEITGRYSKRGSLAQELRTARDLPPQFRLGHKDPFFPAANARAPKRLKPWGPEVSPDWLYFLDEEQVQVCDQLVEMAEEVLLDEGYYTIHFLLGGPGTGKTSILLQLLRRLSNQVAPNAESWVVGLDVSDELARYITASTGWKLDDTRAKAESPALTDVMLVDDPLGEWQIKDLARQANEFGRPKVAIVAFDPLQLNESVSDAAYRKIVREHKATEWHLRASYRQKEAVGRTALNVANVVAASSPFLDTGKQRRYAAERASLTQIANELVFRNPSGYAVSYPNARVSDWRGYVQWLRSQIGLWKHWSPLLIVIDDDTTLPRDWRVEVAEIRHERVQLKEIDSIKGLEYQHVALVLSQARYAAVQDGFTGSGRRLYDDYRLLRIPFTRAKDSLAVFARV